MPLSPGQSDYCSFEDAKAGRQTPYNCAAYVFRRIAYRLQDRDVEVSPLDVKSVLREHRSLNDAFLEGLILAEAAQYVEDEGGWY